MAHPDEYSVRDIWRAAYVVALGVPCVRAMPLDERRTLFILDNTDGKAARLVEEYVDGTGALVLAPALADAYRTLFGLSKAARFGEPTASGRRSRLD